jgi:hypothetical protein
LRVSAVFAGDEGQEGVDRGLKGTGVLLDLGEQQAALEDGKQGYGVVVTVDVRREVAGGRPARTFEQFAADYAAAFS